MLRVITRAHEIRNRIVSRWAVVLLPLALGLAVALQAQDLTRKVIARTAPDYPELARKAHLAGKVKVRVVIAANGSVTSAKLVGGNPVFERNAIEAVRQWKFESAPKETTAIIVLEFADQ